MLWVYGLYIFPVRGPYLDVRIWRLKTIPSEKVEYGILKYDSLNLFLGEKNENYTKTNTCHHIYIFNIYT